ncbi:hypothetical protein EV368DRAFT_66707 [Lentinula lateritia]|uniref:Uncharacterized protein n=1 Tax=Lentinula aff. lateritia TaxID=2804960 RepID=A0ACC1TS38_9AGAR|nr:hypothetical protein F5876DRAFT_68035 [Lentinula aff. lateritia]KAJ3850307.1 hypothetical protein EV368DRAFT_66707 [Lentinula lateritia]
MQEGLDNFETKLQTDTYLHLVAFSCFLIFGKAFLCYDHVLTFGNNIVIISIFFSTRYFASSDAINSGRLIGSQIGYGFVSLLNTNSCLNAVGRLSRHTGFERVGIIITRLDTCFLSFASSLSAALVAVGWEALLLYDLLLFGMTLAKAYQARYQLGPRHIRGMSLISVIIRDGTIYFAIMSLVNFVNVFTFYVTGNSLLRAAFSPITSCLSVTIMSRLMLHLHKIGTQGIYADHAKTLGPISRDQEEYGMTFTTLWSNSDPSATDSSGVGDLSAFEQGSSSGLQIRS